MNVSEYIACLEKLKAEHGDLKVVSRSSYGVMGAFRFTGEPRMILTCPACCARHIDKGEFATKVRHTHSCQTCGLTWRPAVVATVGVNSCRDLRTCHDTSR